jgi:hypothetical protein
MPNTYILIVTESAYLHRQRTLQTPDTRIDFIGLCTQTIGRHFGGTRYNVIINHTRHADLANTGDERITDWYNRELIRCAHPDVKILNGGDSQ